MDTPALLPLSTLTGEVEEVSSTLLGRGCPSLCTQLHPFPLHPQSSRRAVPALPALATAAWEAAAVVGPTLLPLHPHSSRPHCHLLLPLQPITIKLLAGSLSIMPAPNSSNSCCFHPIPTLPGIQTQPPTCWRLLMTTLRYLLCFLL